MPSSPKIPKERILQAALELLLEEGYAAVNIKAVAARLGCSTQPISWQFGGMEGLRRELYAAAWRYANEKYPFPTGETLSSFLKSGWRAVDMALDEPNLFRFLYMGESGQRVQGGLSAVPEGWLAEATLERLSGALGLPREAVLDFRTTMFLYTHGAAVMFASGVAREDDREAVHRMVRQTGDVYLRGLGVPEERLADFHALLEENKEEEKAQNP